MAATIIVATIILITHLTDRGLMNTVSVTRPKLEIVWRNPRPIGCCRRCEHVEEGSHSSLYFVQEFLSTGQHGFWTTTSRLEVISAAEPQRQGTIARTRLSQSR